ncbi:unnamed protein product [Ixodes persulcatus]
MSPLHNLLYRWKHGIQVDRKPPILKENKAKHKGKKAGPLLISVTGSPSFPVGSAETRVHSANRSFGVVQFKFS